MTKRERAVGRLTGLRWILIGFGVASCVLGLGADAIGLSGSPGLGTLQLIMVAAGVLLLLLGLLGRKIVEAYRGTALVLANTVVLLVVVNTAAGVVLRLLPAADGSAEQGISLAEQYAGEPWVDEYVSEYVRIHGRSKYHPFVIWRLAPFEGRMINVDERGIRRTEGVECAPDSYRVLVFGGSTMWGVGAPDWGTIPSYLAAAFEKRDGRRACVVNFGEHGFVSRQGVIQLIAELDAGRVPDLVIFYDGINDAFTAALTGKPGTHYQVDEIAAKFEAEGGHAAALLRGTSLFRLLSRPRPVGPAAEIPPDHLLHGADSLAAAVVDVYLNNLRVVGTLAREYGFDYHFFWQPNLITGAKPATPVEQRMKDGMAPVIAAYLTDVYDRVEKAAREREHLHYIADAFADVDAHVYIDWMHILPAGNRIVAEAMMAALPPHEGGQAAPAPGRLDG